MMLQKQTIAILSLLRLGTTSAFSPARAGVPSPSTLEVGAIWTEDRNNRPMTYEGAVFWMPRATNCANSESLDLEEAKVCLQGLSHINLADLASDKASAVMEVVTKLQRKLSITEQ